MAQREVTQHGLPLGGIGDLPEDDPWMITTGPRRLQTDSVVECPNLQPRMELEKKIAEILSGKVKEDSAGRGVADTLITSFMRHQTASTDAETTERFTSDVESLEQGNTWTRLATEEPWSRLQTEEVSSEQNVVPETDECLAEKGIAKPVDPNLEKMREAALMGKGLSGCTTIMVKEVPPLCTSKVLLQEIDGAGFSGLYDFFYLPIDARSRANRGFAFVNFVSADVAEDFYRHFHGGRLQLQDYDEHVLSILPADIQGYDANAEKYSMAKSSKSKRSFHSKPLFLRAAKAAEQPPTQPPMQPPMQLSPQRLAQQKQFGQPVEDQIRHPAQMRQSRQLQQLKQLKQQIQQIQQLQQDTQQRNRGYAEVAPQPSSEDTDPHHFAPGIAAAKRPGKGSTPLRRDAAPKAKVAPKAASTKKAADHILPSFCGFCGQRRRIDHSFCPYCGAQFSVSV